MSNELVAPATEPSAPQLAVELTTVQQTALRELGSGGNIADAARAAGVDRRTVSRWIHEDEKFAAAYNAWCNELLDSGGGRALAISDAALTTLAKAIQNGHVNAALQLVKNLGILRPPKAGPTDAEELRRRRAVRKARREKELCEAEFEHGVRAQGGLEKDGIVWTKEAKRRLSWDEQKLLEFLREKTAGREQRDCSEFSPLDHGRHLTPWERRVLLRAREEAVLEGNILFHGHVLPAPRGTNGALIQYSKREMFEMLLKGGVDKDEAMQLLANYRRPYPGFYDPNDLPYAEDAEKAEQPAAGASLPPADATPDGSISSEPSASDVLDSGAPQNG
jgi:hypothetical protein